MFSYVSWSTSKLRERFVPLIMFKPSSIFTDRSKAVLLLWILFVIYYSHLSSLYCLICSLQPCDQLLVKGRPLSSFVCDDPLCGLSLSNMVYGVSVSIPDRCLLLYFNLYFTCTALAKRRSSKGSTQSLHSSVHPSFQPQHFYGA